MKRLIRLAARLYPAAWRNRYGLEFQALLDDTNPRWWDIVDVLNGGLQMQFRRAHPALTTAAFGIIGAVLSGAIAFNVADRFESRGTMSVQGAAPAAAREPARPEDVMPGLARDTFGHDTLTGIIEKHDLYRSDRAQRSTEEVVNRMRGDIGIQLVSKSVFQVSFVSSDAPTAQQVVQDLMNQLAQSKEGASGVAVRLIDPPDEPHVFASPHRVAVASVGGFGGGALIGTLIGWLRRRGPQRAS